MPPMMPPRSTASRHYVGRRNIAGFKKAANAMMARGIC